MGAPPLLLEDAATREDEPTPEDAGALVEEPPEVATELESTTEEDITAEDPEDAAGMLEDSSDEETAGADEDDVNVVALLPAVEVLVVVEPPLLLADALVHMPWVHTCWAPQSAVVLHAVWQVRCAVLHTSLLRQSWDVLQVSLGVHASSAPRARHPPRTSRCVKRPMWLGSVARR